MILSNTQIKARNDFLIKLNDGKYRTIKNVCICGATNDLVISNRDRYDIPLTSKLCLSCGLLRSDPYYTESTLKDFYANEYRTLYTENKKPTQEFFEDQIIKGRKILKIIKSKIDNLELKDKVVFEIGTGAGGILLPFKEAGCNVYGCDLGGDYLKIGKQKGLNLYQGDVDVLKSKGKADIIILNHVIEHFVNPELKIKEVLGLLNKKGYVYISVPGLNYHPYNYGALENYLQNAHIYSFTKNTLSNILYTFKFKEIYANEKVEAIYQRGEGKSKKVNIFLLKNLLILSNKYPALFIKFRDLYQKVKKIKLNIIKGIKNAIKR